MNTFKEIQSIQDHLDKDTLSVVAEYIPIPCKCTTRFDIRARCLPYGEDDFDCCPIKLDTFVWLCLNDWDWHTKISKGDTSWIYEYIPEEKDYMKVLELLQDEDEFEYIDIYTKKQYDEMNDQKYENFCSHFCNGN